jgi:predicted site-specific integrase-resolvase
MTKLTQLLTPGQAAERLRQAGIKISDEAVRQWLRADRLASVQLPSGRRLIRSEDVDAIISSGDAPVSAA